MIELLLLIAGVLGGLCGYLMGIAAATRPRMGPPRGTYGPRQPEQPLAADMIRYVRWRDEQIRRACTEPIRFDEGSTARTTSRTGPTAAKPSIVPKPQYPGGYISLEGAQPLRGRRFQPLPDELDAYCPQDDTPNPPPDVP